MSVVSRIRTMMVAVLSTALVTLAPAKAGAQQLMERTDSVAVAAVPVPQRVAELDIPIYPAVAPSPNGRFIVAQQVRPEPVLWIVPLGGGEPFAFRKQWATYHPRWAPSGNRIGFIPAFGPQRVWTVEVDPETGRAMDPPRMLHRTEVTTFAFSPDGERIAYVARRSTAAGTSEIYIATWESRAVRYLLRESGMVYRLDWSPDGRSLYYGLIPDAPSENAAHRVRRANVSNGAMSSMLEVGEYLGLSPDGQLILHRPVDADPEEHDVLAITSVDLEPIARLRIPAGPTPFWGAGPEMLLQVQPGDSTDAVWVIPTCLASACDEP